MTAGSNSGTLPAFQIEQNRRRKQGCSGDIRWRPRNRQAEMTNSPGPKKRDDGDLVLRDKKPSSRVYEPAGGLLKKTKVSALFQRARVAGLIPPHEPAEASRTCF